MTAIEWAKCVVVLRSSYGASFKLDDAACEVWFELLGDLPGERVQAAVAHMCKTQRAFPSIADIRALADPPAVDAGQAWSTACRWVSELSKGPAYVDGVAQALPAIDPAVAAAVDAVGRESVRMREPETEGVIRAHFAKAYEAELGRRRREADGLVGPAPVVDLLADARRSLIHALPAVSP